jgi:hypothetical protein
MVGLTVHDGRPLGSATTGVKASKAMSFCTATTSAGGSVSSRNVTGNSTVLPAGAATEPMSIAATGGGVTSTDPSLPLVDGFSLPNTETDISALGSA